MYQVPEKREIDSELPIRFGLTLLYDTSVSKAMGSWSSSIQVEGNYHSPKVSSGVVSCHVVILNDVVIESKKSSHYIP